MDIRLPGPNLEEISNLLHFVFILEFSCLAFYLDLESPEELYTGEIIGQKEPLHGNPIHWITLSTSQH